MAVLTIMVQVEVVGEVMEVVVDQDPGRGADSQAKPSLTACSQFFLNPSLMGSRNLDLKHVQ